MSTSYYEKLTLILYDALGRFHFQYATLVTMPEEGNKKI